MFRKMAINYVKKTLSDPVALMAFGATIVKLVLDKLDSVGERESLAEKINKKIDLPILNEPTEYVLFYNVISGSFRLLVFAFTWLKTGKVPEITKSA